MNDPHAHGHAQPLDYAGSSLMAPQATSVYVGGGLGIAGSLVGILIFLAACFGLEAAFKLSLLPLILGTVGFLLASFGALFTRAKVEDTHVVAAMFIGLFAIVGGLLETAVWLRWTIFYPAS